MLSDTIIVRAMRDRRIAIERAERAEAALAAALKKKCGCLHPGHPGFVCGYPLPYAEKDRRIIDGVTCGCEG